MIANYFKHLLFEESDELILNKQMARQADNNRLTKEEMLVGKLRTILRKNNQSKTKESSNKLLKI